MSRTNEELAIAAQAGEKQAAHELWEGVKRFAAKTAIRWDNAFEGRNGVTVEDLINAAYIAMVDAVATYKPDSGAFLTWYGYYLKTAFCDCYGVRKRHTDPLNGAQSLDAPLGDEDGTFSDVIADPNGEAPLRDMEEELYQRQLHDALEAELDKLPEEYSAVLRMRYYDDMTYTEIAAVTGGGPSKVHTLEGKGLQKIRYSSTAEHLLDFYDFDYYHGTGLRRFKETGVSIQERYLMNLERTTRQRQQSYDRFSWNMGYFPLPDTDGGEA